MEDASLRLEFHRAMDAVTPSAPWLGPRIREELQRRRRETLTERIRRRPAEYAWIVPAVAVVLAIAIIVGELIGHRLSIPQPIPIGPHNGAASGCPTWGYVPGGPNEPSALRMFSSSVGWAPGALRTSVGWAPGALRTTDGGANWHDVSPKDLRTGEPFLPGQQTVYPPNYQDFFLDADHAWLVRSFESDTRCIDHYTVFGTSDGGRTWQRSNVGAADGTSPVLDFIDPQHGWLVVTVANPNAPLSPSPRNVQSTHTVVYRTADGGRTWRHVSNAGPSCGSVQFVSPSRGFSAGTGQFGGCSSLMTTNDGGATWSAAAVSGTVGPVVFFDSLHGAVVDIGSDGSYAIYVTADGGRTWRQTAAAQSGTAFAPGGFEPYAANVWFEDQHNFWIFTTQPGFNKLGPMNDWLYHSADGGLTWQLVQRNTRVGSVQSVSFVDPSHWFVLQTDNTGAIELLVTSDGGHTWSEVQVHVT